MCVCVCVCVCVFVSALCDVMCDIFNSLCRQVAAINRLTSRGMHFWDYGNAFLLEASRAGNW